MPRRNRLTSYLVLVALAGILVAAPAMALSPARTQENIQRKAVVITHDAKLYSDSDGGNATEAPFMQVYFLLTGEASDRVPVSIEPNKAEPDGWLTRGSFTEWNTLQLINFESQTGRELARIFADAGCAQRFGDTAEAGGCEELGSEPRRSGKQRDDYALLIPVFERDGNTYQGGFVRVTADGPAVAPQVNPDGTEPAVSSDGQLGYDLILVVDATASMEQWFRPTTQALRTFIRTTKSQIGGGELQTPFNVGLLFYRDRKAQPDCDIGFLTRWAVDLTDDIESVASALEEARETSCGSDEIAEAVYDGLNRAVQDPRWNDGNFRVVLLIGDAPPHSPANRDKNPLGFTVDAVTEMAQERNLRFLTFKIGLDGTEEFAALAASGKAETQGRFRALEPRPAEYEQALLAALTEEWSLLTKRNLAFDMGVEGEELARDPGLQRELDIDSYDLPIIIANLPPTSSGKAAPDFVEGWVPKKILGKLALGEYVFMGRREVKIFANVIETVALEAQDGITEGSDAFLKNLRSSLAQMLNVKPEELFRSGESLESMMRKANILPFRTTVLSFTAEEVNAWKPADFERLNTILAEKTTVLREYVQKPANLRLFGSTPYVYVPRDLFP